MKNNNKGVIILLIIIILILATLCILFATSTIVFNTISKNNHLENTTTNNQENSNVTNKENNFQNNITSIYYQYYPEEEEIPNTIHTFDILELKSDGTAKLHGSKRNSGAWGYEGTYTETENEIIFKGTATKEYEEVEGTTEYTKTFKKQEKQLIDELTNWTYSQVTEDELKS